MKEYRATIKVAGWKPTRDEIESDATDGQVDRLLAWLDDHVVMGPAISMSRDGIEVAVATTAPTEAEAAREMFDALSRALQAVGVEGAYPAVVEIEPV